jgi:hypothetical protein
VCKSLPDWCGAGAGLFAGHFPKLALSDISLQCNDLSLSGQSRLSRLVYRGEFMSSRPSHTKFTLRPGAVVPFKSTNRRSP